MSINPQDIFLVCLSAVGIVVASWWAVKGLIAYLISRQIVDRPGLRTLHEGVIPRGGGLVIIAALLISLIFIALLSGRYSLFLTLALIIALWAGLSWSDDRFDLSPKGRLFAQLVFAFMSILAFGWVSEIQYSATGWIPLYWVGGLVTFIGIIWMANLYNFMDGIDGMAASQTIIAAITIGFWLWRAGDDYFAAALGVLGASSYGFLLWNWQPAKVFMGDVGSVTIGAFFAIIVVLGVTRYDLPVLSFVLLFAVFVADATVTLTRRVVLGEKFWLPHRSHYYQRLANAGVSHSKIVCGAIVTMLLCSLIASITVVYRDIIAYAMLTVGILLALIVVMVLRVEAFRLQTHRDEQSGS